MQCAVAIRAIACLPGRRRRRPACVRNSSLEYMAGGRSKSRTDDQFGMAATAHVTVFSLGLVSASLGGRGFDGGWKEI